MQKANESEKKFEQYRDVLRLDENIEFLHKEDNEVGGKRKLPGIENMANRKIPKISFTDDVEDLENELQPSTSFEELTVDNLLTRDSLDSDLVNSRHEPRPWKEVRRRHSVNRLRRNNYVRSPLTKENVASLQNELLNSSGENRSRKKIMASESLYRLLKNKYVTGT